MGRFATEQWERRAQAAQDEHVLGEMASRVPPGRVGAPEEFASTACHLASDRASYVTGTAINVDGRLSPVV